MASVSDRHPGLLGADDTGLIVVDVQEAFRPVIDRFDETVANVGLLAEGFGVLGRPVLVSEQYTKGLGATVAEVADRLPAGAPRIEKLRFSAVGVEQFDRALEESGVRRWVVAGIEAHVCVNQTVLDLLGRGHEVHVAVDAVSSRSPRNVEMALEKLRAAGAALTSAEAALFEMLVEAGTPEFKQISKLVR